MKKPSKKRLEYLESQLNGGQITHEEFEELVRLSLISAAHSLKDDARKFKKYFTV